VIDSAHWAISDFKKMRAFKYQGSVEELKFYSRLAYDRNITLKEID
jgi:hypothetical protein